MAVRVGHLGERGVEDGDVVGGGVAARVPAPQRRGEELAGVVAERQHRVVAERLLERRRRLLLLAVTDHDRGVQVDHQPGQLPPGRPRRRERLAGELGALRPDDLPGRGPSPRDRAQLRGVEAVEQPPARRVRRHRPEQRGLIGQHRDVGDRRRAIGDRDRHVDQHPTRIVARPRLAQPGQRLGELPGQRGPVRDIGEQPRPSMRHHTLAVSGRRDRRSGRCSLHLESAPLPGGPATSAIPVSPGSGALSSIQARTRRPAHEEPGPLVPIELRGGPATCHLSLFTRRSRTRSSADRGQNPRLSSH